MNQIYLFIDLIRLKKPIGFMLLFWPCAWGLTVAYDFSGQKITYFFYLFLFLSGAILIKKDKGETCCSDLLAFIAVISASSKCVT